MFGPPESPPYDFILLIVLVALMVLLIIGANVGAHWPLQVADSLRRGALGVSVLGLAFVLIATPSSNSIVGAARLISIWPLTLLNILLFILWSWRSQRW